MNITLSSESVGKVFASLSGEQSAQFEDLCVAATRSICSRLRPVNCLNREAELIHAAACLAYYRYTLSKIGEGMSSYKAGDITINSDITSAINAAKALLDDALEVVKDCFKTGGFCFKTV